MRVPSLGPTLRAREAQAMSNEKLMQIWERLSCAEREAMTYAAKEWMCPTVPGAPATPVPTGAPPRPPGAMMVPVPER